MLADSAFILIAAATFGALLSVVQLQRPKSPPIPLPVGVLHGLLGATGLTLMLLAPAASNSSQAGAGGFRMMAAVLLGLALLMGLLILRARLGRRRLSFTVVGVHAFLAISGVVLLGAYLAVS
jgi:hypothetical protein